MTSQTQPKLLLIDDEPWICDALTALLTDEGFDVTVAGNAKQCFDALARQTGDCFAAIIMDWHLKGGMEGQELLDQIHLRCHRTPVFVVSGDPSVTEMIQKTRGDGVLAVNKPIMDFSAFAELVKHTATHKDDHRP